MEILVIDDDAALCRTLQVQLAVQGHETRTAHTPAEGIEIVRTWAPLLVLLDVHLPGASGIDLVPDVLQASPDSSVVIVTGDPENVIVSRAMMSGALDCLRKPFDLADVSGLIARVEELRGAGGDEAAAESEEAAESFVGQGREALALHKKIGLLARSRVPVLIVGESGTGKELAARLLHRMTSEKENFVALNCSAIVPTLLESELFGHEKGAFTGAGSAKKGKLEHAGRGTIFFDEIGDLPMELQGKLLRVIQEEEFVTVGGLDAMPLRARIVAATHRDLEDLIQEGRFRQDLFYRLNVARLEVKPLRERREDLPALTRHFLARLGRRHGRRVRLPDRQTMKLFMNYSWPGNIRELENLLTRAMALSTGPDLSREEIESYFADKQDGGARGGDTTLAEAEKKHINEALERFSWNISRTARELDISPTTLRKKITDFGFRPDRRRKDS